MRLYSWNINGIRAVLRKGALQSFLETERPDILCLQEVKASPSQIDYGFPGYKVFFNPAKRAGYSGTAVLVSEKLNATELTLDLSELAINEGRILALDLGDAYLINVYTPNSKPDLSRLSLRERTWDPEFLNLLKTLEQEKPIITCGDFNAAHTEMDIARPKTNHHSAGFTDEERQGITNLVNAGLVDTFRLRHPDEQRYSWWSHWGHARENNVGWRIDYFFISSSLKPKLKDADIHESIMGSDHCPVSIELEI